MHKCSWVLNPLLLSLTLPAIAAEEENLIVNTNRSQRTVAEVAQTTWVIEGSEIEQQAQGGKEFKDVLAQLIPEIDVSSQGRTNYGMSMRGRAIVVLIDGVRLNPLRTDSRQLDSIDPFNIVHIEVISGTTSLCGGGSTGGLINIVTKKGQPEREVELELGSKNGFNNNSDHDERVAAAVSGGTDRAFGCTSVAYQRFGGWYDSNHDALLLDNTQTELQHSGRLDIMGTGIAELNDNRQLRSAAQYYKSQGDDDYGLDLGENMSAVTGNGKAYTSSGLNSDRIPGIERHLISLQYSDADLRGQNLVSQIYYRDESLKFYPFPTFSKGKVTSSSVSQQDADQFGARITFNSQLMDKWELTWNVDADHETFDSNQKFLDLTWFPPSGGMDNRTTYTTGRYPGYSITNFVPSLQNSYNINDIFTLGGGVCYQWTEDRVDDFADYAQQQGTVIGFVNSADTIPGGKTDYDNFLFNTGILAHLADRQQAWFNSSQGAELPDLGKYYGNGTYLLVGDHYQLQRSVNVADPRLEGVKVNSYELGWCYAGDSLRTQLVVYYSTSNKSIVTNRSDMTINVQPDGRRIYGLGDAVDYLTADTDWSLGGNFNAIKSEVKQNGKRQKWDVILASLSKATTWIGWASEPWTLRMQSQQTFDLISASGSKLDGYNTMDFIGSYQFPLGKLTSSVENLLDEKYTTLQGRRAPLLYSPTYGSLSLYEYKGRGRTFGLNYALALR